MPSTLLRLSPLLAVPWLALTTNAATTNYCPLLGPVFPLPTNLANDAAFTAAKNNISSTLQQAISNGQFGTDSISVQIFGVNDARPLFQYAYTSNAINTTAGVSKVDENTVFRIASVSKLWMMLLFLMEKGISTFQEPIANYIPELQAAVANLQHNSTMMTDQIDFVQWDQITIGELAGQLAGIPRDYGFGDLTEDTPMIEQMGFPPLPPAQVPPCGLPNSCNRTQFFNGLLQRHTVVPTASTPIYSNAAFQIIAYALEAIAGEDYQTLLTNNLINPLGLTRSFYNTPSMKIGVIPDNQGEFYWNLAIGDETPLGGLYSSTKDLSTLGRAILNSSLIPPSVTRRWLKPGTRTSSINYAVGAPWEILSLENPRVVDLYTKSGDIGAYSVVLALSPDHGVGFTVLAAGNTTHDTVALASDLISSILIPALEESAKSEAAPRFTGTYTLQQTSASTSNSNTNSSISITTDEGPGLKITNWISNSTNMFNTLMALEALTDPSLLDVRLYPTTLTSPGSGQISFRAVIQQLPGANAANTGPFTSSCLTWVSVDALLYGSIGVDEFLFQLDKNGNVVGVEPRALRVFLSKD